MNFEKGLPLPIIAKQFLFDFTVGLCFVVKHELNMFGVSLFNGSHAIFLEKGKGLKFFHRKYLTGMVCRHFHYLQYNSFFLIFWYTGDPVIQQ